MASPRSRARQLKSLHLLLVDDSAADRHLVEVMLRGVRGHVDRMTGVATVAAARSALTEHSDIDLVMLDLRLPDSQGLDTVRRILEVSRDVPIIVLTETDDESVGVDCVAAGAQDYLPKGELRALLLGRVVEYAVMRAHDSAARRRLEQEVLETSEHERQRIARDLHDDLGQQLTGISIMVRALASKLAARDLREAGEARELAELVQGAIAKSLALARGLDPLTDFADLPMALEALARDGERMFRIRCPFRSHGEIPAVDETVAAHFYRIAQEAMTNAVKHARAEKVSIELRRAAGALELDVVDDGDGVPDPARFTPGQGLRIMAYRARSVGATFAIERNPSGNGVRVRCTLPVG